MIQIYFFFQFQAMLRLDRHLPYKEKLQKVDQVIAELSLTKCQNTIIGVTGRIKGLSGGERKRLSFASEAITDPSLLLCDEPTSGLDSFMAHNVLQVLKNLAQKDKTIIVTIHQPSSEIFCMFDKLLLMANGRVAFLGTPTEANEFFTSLEAPCPINYNPADFYVERLAVVPGNEEESLETIRKICDAFSVSEYQKRINDDVNSIRSNSNILKWSKGTNGNGVESYRVSWWAQFRAILWRSWLTVLKEPLLVRVRLIQTVVCMLMFSKKKFPPILIIMFSHFPVGRCCCWNYILWSTNDTGWRNEYQRSNFPLSYQYDVPKCLLRCKRTFTNSFL